MRSGGAKIKHEDGRIELVEEPTRPARTEIDGLPEEEREAAIERHRVAALGDRAQEPQRRTRRPAGGATEVKE